MKVEINSQIVFPQKKHYSLMLYAVENDLKTLNTKQVLAIQNMLKKILGAYSFFLTPQLWFITHTLCLLFEKLNLPYKKWLEL